VVLLAALLAVAPELIRGASCGHDFDFHLASWLDVQNAWRHGLFYPHWAPSANYGAGEARFVFYPPLTWMLGAALGLVMPWTLVPAALTFLLLAGTGLATRTLARELLSDGAATLAGCAALFSGYSLFTAYERSAFGELAGGFWIPLLLIFALRNAGAKDVHGTWRRACDGAVAPLALVVAGAWLSNAPLGVMASYLLALVALIAAAQARSWVPVMRAGIGAGLGLALAAFYLIPAAYEQRWVNIAQATDDPGERIENSFLFGHHGDPLLALHDVELQRVSWLAVSMLAVTLVGFLLAWKRGRFSFAQCGSAKQPAGAKAPDSKADGFGTTKVVPCYKARAESREQEPNLAGAEPDSLREESSSCPTGRAVTSGTQSFGRASFWLPLALVPVAILLLQLPVSLPVWNLLPKLRFLQFPWRWLVALEAPMGIFLAAAVWPGERARRWIRPAVAAAFALLFVAATGFAARSFFQACDDEDAVAGMLSAYRTGEGFVGTDEYAPLGADNTLAASGLPGACLVSDPKAALGVAPAGDGSAAGGDDAPTPEWTAEQGSCAATFAMTAHNGEDFSVAGRMDRSGYLILRLRGNPAWKARLNGQPVTPLATRADGLMAVPVQAGNVDLRIEWTATQDVVLGRWISGLAALLITAVCAVWIRP